MSAILGPTNPLAWAQFHLKGGVKTFFTVTFAYGGVIGVILALTWWSARTQRDVAEILEGWAVVLTMIQAFAVMVMGTGAVSASIKHDLTTSMIESHRLMPIPASHVIAGYITGAPIQAIGIFCMNLILGSVISAGLGRPVSLWLAISFIVLGFAMFVWTVAAFAVFIAKKAGMLVIIFGGFAFFSRDGIARVVPAVMVVAGPVLGGSLFDVRQGNMELHASLIISFAAQILMGAIFFIGAVRKFKRPDQLALGTRLGFALLFVWVMLNLDGMLQTEFYFGSLARSDQEQLAFIGSSLSSMLLALIVLANASREYVLSYKRRVDDPDLKLRAMHPLFSGILAGLIICLLLFGAPPHSQISNPQILSAIGIIAYCVAIAFLTAWTYDIVNNAKLILIIWLVITWIIPLVIALLMAKEDKWALSAVAFSPPACLIMIWTAGNEVPSPLPGVIAQALYCLVPFTLYLKRRALQRNLSLQTEPKLPELQ